jgi:hypothetical protein
LPTLDQSDCDLRRENFAPREVIVRLSRIRLADLARVLEGCPQIRLGQAQSGSQSEGLGQSSQVNADNCCNFCDESALESARESPSASAPESFTAAEPGGAGIANVDGGGHAVMENGPQKIFALIFALIGEDASRQIKFELHFEFKPRNNEFYAGFAR